MGMVMVDPFHTRRTDVATASVGGQPAVREINELSGIHVATVVKGFP